MAAFKELTLDPVLTEFAVDFMQSDDGKRRVLQLPGVVPVSKRSGKYRKWSKGDILRSEMKPRSRGTAAAIGDQGVSLEDYSCERHAIATKLTDEDYDDFKRMGMSEAAATVEAEKSKVRWLVEQSYLFMAKQFGDTVLAAASWGTGVGGNANQTGAASAGSNQFIQWDRSGGLPLTNILTQNVTLESSIGRGGNVLIVGPSVHLGIRLNSTVQEQLKYTSSEIPREGRLADLFEVDQYVKVSAAENTANEGQTVSMSNVFGAHALLAYFSPENTVDSPAAAKIFSFEKYGGWPAGVPRIFSFYEEKTRTWYFETEIYFDIKITAPDAGVFFSGAVQ